MAPRTRTAAPVAQPARAGAGDEGTAPQGGDRRRLRPLRRLRRVQPHHKIALGVAVFYYLAGLWILRHVITTIPSVLDGKNVIAGDELVPFFNPTSQLFDQAKGKYSELTNGYEFRVRYAFLTTWFRYYQVLPFALLIAPAGLVWTAYATTSWFMSRAFPQFSKSTIYLSTIFPSALIYLIMFYAKVTHFYTLVLGLVMMLMSAYVMLDALLFRDAKWFRRMGLASFITLMNPAVHYLILFALFISISVATLIVGECAKFVRDGGPRALLRFVRHRPWRREVWCRRPPPLRRMLAGLWGGWKALAGSTTGRCAWAMFSFVTVALIPYGLFVKFVALRGIPNLSETVPGDFYFIKDASVSLVHVLSWDLAGIMDKIQFGDYLAKVPRVSNMVYMALAYVALLPVIRRRLFVRRPQRQLLGVIYVNSSFAIWATVGYGDPTWLPTFHRSLSAVTRALYATRSPIGDLTLSISSTIVQVLRFPHRFQLILFMLAPMLMGLPIMLLLDRLQAWALGSGARTDDRRFLVPRIALAVAIGSVFFLPFLGNRPYRNVFGSGDFAGFFAPYPVEDLKDLKAQVRALPPGKTVVFPPTETAKIVAAPNGTDHKFIDKFYIYFLDEPSFYYGLTGDSGNKFEFFLMLRSLYYKQDWWINVARDIGLDYIVLNKQVENNGGIGAEYLPDLEAFIRQQIEAQPDYVKKLYENPSFVLYELTDKAEENRERLLLDTSWNGYLQAVFNRLDLSRCYDLEYLSNFEGTTEDGPPVNLLATDPQSAMLDIWARNNLKNFFTPSSKTFAFDPNVIASSYYLSPMFRLYLFFSDTKWNRNEMITPGIFGTLKGSFIGLPRATQLTLPINVPAAGRYRMLMRTAATANSIHLTAASLAYDQNLELRSPPDALRIYEKSILYDPDRQPTDISGMTPKELESRIPAELVPVNFRYAYQDLGVVDASAGPHKLVLDKLDSNPMLVEGVLLIPEEAYENLAMPDLVRVIDKPSDLRCSTVHPARTGTSEGVAAVGNDAHDDLTQEQMLELLGGDELRTPELGGLGAQLPILLATFFIVMSCAGIVYRHASHDPDAGPEPADDVPDASPGSVGDEPRGHGAVPDRPPAPTSAHRRPPPPSAPCSHAYLFAIDFRLAALGARAPGADGLGADGPDGLEATLLVAVALSDDGTREVLAMEASSRGCASPSAFVGSLGTRGLSGVRLVVTDLEVAALPPGAARQWCQADFGRKLAALAPPGGRAAVAEAIDETFRAGDPATLAVRWVQLRSRLSRSAPNGALVMHAARHDVLAFAAVPPGGRPRLWSLEAVEPLVEAITGAIEAAGPAELFAAVDVALERASDPALAWLRPDRAGRSEPRGTPSDPPEPTPERGQGDARSTDAYLRSRRLRRTGRQAASPPGGGSSEGE